MNKYIIQIQRELKKFGYYNGDIDGIAGKRTLQGVQNALDDTGKSEVKNQIKGNYKLSARSLNRLRGVHPDLVKVVKRAIEISPYDFTVIEGLRTYTKQKQLMTKGATRTMNSRHLTGHAVDIAPIDEDGKISWDWEYYYPLAEAVKRAARELGITIEWGGDWNSFKDGPHWQLPWNKYPK